MSPKNPAAVALGRLSVAAKRRRYTPEELSQQAKMAAQTRWEGVKKKN